MVEEEKFLIDTNSFVAPYRLYYAFDLVPTYWKELSKKADTGRLILLDMVKEEIDKGDDALADWLAKQTGFIVCGHVSEEVINQYRAVLQYVQTCGLYREQALAAWVPENIADPWLIAAAKVNGYTIITGEVPSSGLSKKTPNRNAKIPDVANAFGVKTADLYYMMRQLAIRI